MSTVTRRQFGAAAGKTAAAALLSARMVTSAYPTALEMLLDSAQTRLAALRENRPATP